MAKVRLLAFLLCDNATRDHDGKVTLQGIFDKIIALGSQTLPASVRSVAAFRPSSRGTPRRGIPMTTPILKRRAARLHGYECCAARQNRPSKGGLETDSGNDYSA